MKALTGIPEIVALGHRHGYIFDAHDLKVGSSAMAGPNGNAPNGNNSRATTSPETRFYHYEYTIGDIPGFEAVLGELPGLKVKPPSVDLDLFHQEFRAEDLCSTSDSPTDPEFRAWHEKMARAHWRDGTLTDPPRRDFHLINLDEHVDCPGYERYFEAKIRLVGMLEDFFGGEVRFSGSLWYPPSSYRLWHTNENQPGWRMYIVDFDAPFTARTQVSFFRYLNPRTKEIVTLPEKPRIVRFFKVEQDPDQLFWHCIVNPSTRDRWSFGFAVPENWLERIERQR